MGVQRFAESLIRTVAEQDNVDCFVFVDENSRHHQAEGHLAECISKVSVPNRGLLSWWLSELPSATRKRDLDLFIAPNCFLGPRRLARRHAVVVHDLAHLAVPWDLPRAYRLQMHYHVPAALRWADYVCAVSDTVAREVRTWYRRQLQPHADLVVIANQVAHAPIEPWSERRNTILFVGQRKRRKDLANVIAGFARVYPALGTDAHLALVGPPYDQEPAIEGSYRGVWSGRPN
jgi:glycosyltransferase involved in cell wall biosynthesis